MGLDNFWVMPGHEEDRKDQPVPSGASDLHLVGGMFSSHGADSFRGKCYEGIVDAATRGEMSLYDEIDNDGVGKIANSLEDLEWTASFGEKHDVDQPEFEDLKKMFRIYADAGASLSAWF